MKKRKISYFRYSLVLAILLSVLTFVVSFLSPIFDRRLVYRLIYYSAMNFSFLIGLALFTNWKGTLMGMKIKKYLFLSVTIIYSFIYTISSFSFLFTSQAIEYQTLLFVYKVKPITTLLFYGTLLLIILFLSSFVLSKKYVFVNLSWEKRFWPRTLFFISLVIFFICVFMVYSVIGVFNPIVVSYSEGNVIFSNFPNVLGNELINQRSNLKDPNVIYILVDSVSFDRLGSYGYPRNVTPNLDFLASNGIKFKNAYSTATHSDYAQPGYLSSKYMLVNDYRNFFNGNNRRTFVWDIFKERNYTTGYISSQDDLWAGMNKYYNFTNLDYYWYSLTDGKTDYGKGLGKKDYDHKTMNRALSWLEEIDKKNRLKEGNHNKNNSFFLYLNFQATHRPLAFPDKYLINWNDNNTFSKESDRADSALHYIDLQIGRLLNYLDEKNYSNNTVIVFSTDHGDDWYSKHYIKGHGKSIYNEELKVPLIFYIPDLNSKVIEDKVSHIDVLPTVLTLMNITYDENNFIGKPMSKNRRFFFYAQSHKYLIGMIKGDIKTIIDLNRNLVEIYNLSESPEENKNIVYKRQNDLEILELLMWHYCQLNYFSSKNPKSNLINYCEDFA